MGICSYSTIWKLFFLSFAYKSLAASWSDVSAEVENVTAIYYGKTNVIPLQDLSKTLNVSLGMQLLAINDFDDVAGVLDISTYLFMEWTEEIYFNARGSTAPDTSVTISATSVWKPSLMLVNSAGDSTEIVQEQSQVRLYFKSGKCEWTENVVFRASCRPNVYFYPFDVHDCSVKFTTRAYTSSEMALIASTFGKDYFEENVAWSVKKTSAETLTQDSKSLVQFKITIARRSINYILNYVLPILILSGLNVFVFILPRSSGERAGYSVTCFLAFVVFMNAIVTSLPKSSAPVSVLVYYVTVMMTISAVITVLVLFTLMIEKKAQKEKDDKKKEGKKETEEKKKDGDTKRKDDKPSSRRNSYPCCSSNSVVNMETPKQPNQSSNDYNPPMWLRKFVWCLIPKCNDRLKSKNATELEWTDVGNALDVFFFVFFFVGEIIFSIAYLTPVSQQYAAEELKLDLSKLPK